MLQQRAVHVDSVGEDVVLAIGNCSWRMGFEAALSLSAKMRRGAAVAKRIAGDDSRRWGVAGTLHDAENGPDQPFTPDRVYPVARERLKPAQVGASADGSVVSVQLGSMEARLPYPAAFTISQWIRLRAKDSKRRAGDIGRHWSAVTC